MKTYHAFQQKASEIKLNFIDFLIRAKRDGKVVCAYGAAAKGNTLINYAGVKADILQFVSDAAPSKIDKFLPGSRIPIKAPDGKRIKSRFCYCVAVEYFKQIK